MTTPYGQEPLPPPAGQPVYGAQPVVVQPVRQYSFGIFGTVLAVLGAVSCALAFTALKWFRDLGIAKFSDVHDIVHEALGARATTIAKLYFDWPVWILLAVVFIVAILANIPSPSANALRGVGFILGLIGTGLTFWAIQLSSSNVNANKYSEYLKHAQVAFYCAAAGFLVMGIGALIGPRRRI